MSRSMDLCVESAWRHGVPRHNLHDWTFAKLCDSLLIESRPAEYWAQKGCGYWTWKPYIVEREMLRPSIQNGDILIYSDAGVEFINNVSHITDRMDQDIFVFGNNWEHAHWCKADTLEEIIPWRNSSLTSGKQCQASVIFFRVSDYTRKFVKEWLDWCLFEDGRLIDDSPSRIPNHPEFQEHRHDQAILTTMAYRDGLRLHWWPAVYNDGQFTYEKLPEYAGDDYPILFNHHRKRNADWSAAA